MQMEKATPGPWRVVKGTGPYLQIEGEDGWCIATIKVWGGQRDVVEANADLIVQAVNERENLLSQLALFRALFEQEAAKNHSLLDGKKEGVLP